MLKKVFPFLLISNLFGYTFTNLTVESGLSDNLVHSILIDGRGFLWIGTDEGLNRYDGYDIKVYRSNPFDDKTISGNRVWTSFKDKKGNAWFGSDNSVDFYNWSNDTFERYQTDSRPTNFFQDKDGIIWVTTLDKGILKINPSEKTKEILISNKEDINTLSNNSFSVFQKKPIVDSDLGLWVGTNKGLNFYNRETNKFKRFLSTDDPSSISNNTINTLHIDDSYVWVGTNMGLDRIDLDSHGVQRMAYTNWFSMTGMYAVTQIIPFEKNNTMEGGFWMSTYSGLVYYDKNMEGWYDVEHELVFGKPINNVMKDNNGNLWIDLNGELVFFNTSSFYYQYGSIAETDLTLIQKKAGDERSISDVSLTAMISSQKHGTWLGTPKGVSKLVQTNNIFFTIAKESSNYEKVFVDKNNNIWATNETGLLQYDNRGNKKRYFGSDPTNINTLITEESGPFIIDNEKNSIWVASKLSGLSKIELGFDLRTEKDFVNKQKVERYLYDSNNEETVLDGSINQMYLDSDGVLYISFKTGVVTIKGSEIQRFKFSDEVGNYHLSDISSFLETSRGDFWVGSKNHGLFKLNKKDMSVIKHYRLDKADKQSFSSSVVFVLYEDNNKVLWIGTGGDGLYKYIEEKDGFLRNTISNGLPSNTIISIQDDGIGQLWIGTRNGLSRLNAKNMTFTNFGPIDGMDHRIFKLNSLAKNNENKMFVAAGNDIVSFEPSSLTKNNVPPELAISSLSVFDEENNKIKKDINNQRVIVYSNEKKIEIEIVGLSYIKTEKNKFKYRLSKHTNGWVDLGNQRKIIFQGLQPDEYIFNFMASNNDNVWSQPSENFVITVRPPFYKTTWAYSTYLGIMFLTTFGVVKRRDKKQIEKMEEVRRVEELEEARQFQMKMLGKCPKVMDLEISAGIKTATEVGGDYYDFFPSNDSLYVVVGDATGHGMTAGMMVSITKAGLYGTPPNIPPNEVSFILNRTIKSIELGKNKMAINIARFWSDKVELTSAAMPPLYHYKATSGEVDEILLEGLPLGSFKGETYSQVEIPSKPGDAFVFISDGLPEATNKSENMLGYKAVLDCVRENGRNTAEEIKQSLFDLGSAWLGGIQNQDDITVVVVKKTDKKI